MVRRGRPAAPEARQRGQARRQDDRGAPGRARLRDGRERGHPTLRQVLRRRLIVAGHAAVYQRILLKLSGEALIGDLEYGTDPERVETISREIAGVHATGVEVAIVVGGGNIYRGLAAAAKGMDRATGDYMG